MSIILRTIIGLVTGLVGGAIFGAAVSVGFAIPTYLAGHSFFDKLEPLVLIAGIIGGEAGLIVGGIIGLIVGVFALRKLYAALTGMVVILILVVYLVGTPKDFHKEDVLLTILAAVTAAALGTLISAIITRFPGRRTDAHGPSTSD